MVLLCTPPGFRPQHLRAAIDAGKHVFCEKPVAVDAAGVRSVIESARLAKEKNLSLCSGFCYRYEQGKRETVKRIHDGLIGDVAAIHTTFLTGAAVVSRRQPEVEPDGAADAQLVLLHLAVRRLHRRAALPQHRQGPAGC